MVSEDKDLLPRDVFFTLQVMPNSLARDKISSFLWRGDFDRKVLIRLFALPIDCGVL